MQDFLTNPQDFFKSRPTMLPVNTRVSHCQICVAKGTRNCNPKGSRPPRSPNKVWWPEVSSFCSYPLVICYSIKHDYFPSQTGWSEDILPFKPSYLVKVTDSALGNATWLVRYTSCWLETVWSLHQRVWLTRITRLQSYWLIVAYLPLWKRWLSQLGWNGQFPIASGKNHPTCSITTWQNNNYPLVTWHSYWWLPFMVSFPCTNGDFP